MANHSHEMPSLIFFQKNNNNKKKKNSECHLHQFLLALFGLNLLNDPCMPSSIKHNVQHQHFREKDGIFGEATLTNWLCPPSEKGYFPCFSTKTYAEGTHWILNTIFSWKHNYENILGLIIISKSHSIKCTLLFFIIRKEEKTTTTT